MVLEYFTPLTGTTGGAMIGTHTFERCQLSLLLLYIAQLIPMVSSSHDSNRCLIFPEQAFRLPSY